MLLRFWRVGGILDYENVGFSNAVDGVKYLICADCETGPIGFKDTNSDASFLAAARVHHTKAEP